MKAQSVPPAALADPDAYEVARIWVAQKGLHCVLKIGVYQASGIDETRAWGMILADMARHVSDALVQKGFCPNPRIALSSVRKAMADELDRPTSSVEGEFGTTPRQ